MQTLTYHMRCSVLNIARSDKQKAKSRIQGFLLTAHNILQGDELQEFIRDAEVLEIDVEQF